MSNWQQFALIVGIFVLYALIASLVRLHRRIKALESKPSGAAKPDASLPIDAVPVTAKEVVAQLEWDASYHEKNVLRERAVIAAGHQSIWSPDQIKEDARKAAIYRYALRHVAALQRPDTAESRPEVA